MTSPDDDGCGDSSAAAAAEGASVASCDDVDDPTAPDIN